MEPNKKLFTETLDFVKIHTKSFDASHNWEHAQSVYNNMLVIVEDIKSLKIRLDFDILILCALLHDVLDHKYVNPSLSRGDLESFVTFQSNQETCERVMSIIDNVSYSLERDGKRKRLERDEIYLNIIGDADRLEAIGLDGIRRCEIYTKSKGGNQSDVIQHCHDKLLKLYPDGYFKTQIGKTLAKVKHEEIVNWISNLN